ncbi:MAG: hypothetical protein QHH13_14360 [Melioribacter sp.]|uniref:hypothetical protein n=1 Tax=Rosettibacter primus TaxID=3111523 RepID=UPI00247C6A90|nr:hypothetical protein [Melioribacter sp.]
MRKMFVVLLSVTLSLFAQENNNDETKAEVKELIEFHNVIYQLWHTAWPEKNISMMKSLMRPIDEGFEKIKYAELPGILRDKKEKWDEGVRKLDAVIERYRAALVKNDTSAVLKAAEQLHSQYEYLVRIIKPVIKELDSFHQELYMLYHYYTPNYDYNKIKKSAEILKTKMNELMNAKLPVRLENKKEEFNKCKNELNNAVNKLNSSVKKGNVKKDIINAVEEVHSKYQNLEKIFD